MSRSRNGNRFVGRGHVGREYWSRRTGGCGKLVALEAGRHAKKLTHRFERRQARRLERAALTGDEA